MGEVQSARISGKSFRCAAFSPLAPLTLTALGVSAIQSTTPSKGPAKFGPCWPTMCLRRGKARGLLGAGPCQRPRGRSLGPAPRTLHEASQNIRAERRLYLLHESPEVPARAFQEPCLPRPAIVLQRLRADARSTLPLCASESRQDRAWGQDPPDRDFQRLLRPRSRLPSQGHEARQCDATMMRRNE